MKFQIALALSLVLTSLARADGPETLSHCRIDRNLSVEIIRDSRTHALSAIFRQGRKSEINTQVERRDFTPSEVGRDGFLSRIRRAADVGPRGFATASAYITETNNLGYSGVMIFTSKSGANVGDAFFVSYTNYAESCE